jgi:hypothetical protein
MEWRRATQHDRLESDEEHAATSWTMQSPSLTGSTRGYQASPLLMPRLASYNSSPVTSQCGFGASPVRNTDSEGSTPVTRSPVALRPHVVQDRNRDHDVTGKPRPLRLSPALTSQATRPGSRAASSASSPTSQPVSPVASRSSSGSPHRLITPVLLRRPSPLLSGGVAACLTTVTLSQTATATSGSAVTLRSASGSPQRLTRHRGSLPSNLSLTMGEVFAPVNDLAPVRQATVTPGGSRGARTACDACHGDGDSRTLPAGAIVSVRSRTVRSLSFA